MKMRYDPEVDALFIELRASEPAGSFDYEEGVTAVVDATGQVIGLEILDVHHRLAADEADALTVTAAPA